jgi:hypothetical protein
MLAENCASMQMRVLLQAHAALYKTRLAQNFSEPSRGGRELAQIRAENVIGESQVQLAHRSGRFGVRSSSKPSGMAGDDQTQSVVLMWIGLSVFVRVHDAAMIQQRAVTLRRILEASQEISKFGAMPLANIHQDALPFHAVGARRAAVRMRVVVMTRGRVTQAMENA